MIIALGHSKGVGKDTFATFLIERLRQKTSYLEIERTSFAQKLYNVCTELYGHAGFKSKAYYDRNYTEKEQPLANGLTPREILISIGKALTSVDSSVFISEATAPHPGVKIITDLRTKNEYEACESAFKIKIQRAGYQESEDSIDLELKDSHWDYQIYNTSLPALKDQAYQIVDSILIKNIAKETKNA